jgi:hypothetical protein
MKNTASPENHPIVPQGSDYISLCETGIRKPGRRAGRPGSRPLHRLALTVVLALAMLNVFASSALADLTVTVQENADGSATFSLSGTSEIRGGYPDSGIFFTNYSFLEGVPPLRAPSALFPLPLPKGLTLNFGLEDDSVELNDFQPEGSFWYLISNRASGYNIFNPTAVTGRGSVRVENFPFGLLVPGTFRVEGATPQSEVEESEVLGGVISTVGYYGFTTVYHVIPLDRNPSISGKAPGILGSGSGNKSTGLIRITNNGNEPLENISLDEASSDFKLGNPLRTSLAPGESTTCKVTFSSRKPSASTKVSNTAFTPGRAVEQLVYASEEPEIGEIPYLPPPVLEPGEPVGTSVLVRGVNAVAGPASRAPRNPIRLLQSKASGR